MAQRERDVARKHAEMIAQEARSVATAMQAKEVALTEHETEIASLRNQIKKGKYKSQPTVNDNHDANDKSPEPTPADTLVQFMAANPLLHASPVPSMPKHRKTQNPHPNVSSIKANHELKQSKLTMLQPEDKAGWKGFLRQSFLKLTRQTYVSHFKKYNPVTTEIMKQYDSETGPGPQGANQFQLYFDDGWQKLNKREDGIKKLITHFSKPEDKKKWKRVEAVLSDLGELGQSLDDTDVEVEGSALVTTEPYSCWCFLSHVLADLNASINKLQLKIVAQHGKKHLAHPLQICH
ncbi:hypothetical protein BT96DRAFT_1099205 [Gymnopus androsaceus JB14]|uniref:Uncharacterized protein n=1 Tax=Gymnopus androsaceus JB14 TaxID=1447944 RepID=A0A6A4HTP0_9AGAR|nr:hypothetical protein BT96DRAFT_1099205 [Gymnopus androsaceus JB14]